MIRTLRLAVLAVLMLAQAPRAIAQDDASAAVDEPAAPEYGRELRTVEEDVKALKERVFRSKATLQLLKEIVIEGAAVGSRVQLFHVNKMGPAYTMESIQYFLDGKSVFARVAIGGDLDDLKDILVHEATIPPGTHELSVQIVLRGSGLAVFSYLEEYSFKVQSNYQFKVQDGELTRVRVIANERSGLMRTFVDRPSVEYDETVESIRRE